MKIVPRKTNIPLIRLRRFASGHYQEYNASEKREEQERKHEAELEKADYKEESDKCEQE